MISRSVLVSPREVFSPGAVKTVSEYNCSILPLGRKPLKSDFLIIKSKFAMKLNHFQHFFVFFEIFKKYILSRSTTIFFVLTHYQPTHVRKIRLIRSSQI